MWPQSAIYSLATWAGIVVIVALNLAPLACLPSLAVATEHALRFASEEEAHLQRLEWNYACVWPNSEGANPVMFSVKCSSHSDRSGSLFSSWHCSNITVLSEPLTMDQLLRIQVGD